MKALIAEGYLNWNNNQKDYSGRKFFIDQRLKFPMPSITVKVNLFPSG
jgi:hypothetical protein